MIGQRGKLRSLRRARPSTSSARRAPGDAPSRRRRVRRVGLLVIAIVLGVFGVVRRGRPDIDPARLALRGGLQVKEFGLVDAGGHLHTPADWRGRQGVVLIFLGAEDPPASTKDLLARAAGGGLLTYLLDADPDRSPAAFAERITRLGLAGVALSDPGRRVARQAGIARTPQGVVLAPDGQVLFRGRVGKGFGDAVKAVAGGELPAVAEVEGADGQPMPAPASASETRRVTYTRDVAPILWKNCAGCHRPGEVAPFSLLTYRDAAKRADFLAEVAASRRMPPWKPHPGFGVFDGTPQLSERERAVLDDWATAGAPEGDLADLPAPPVFAEGWQLGQPDLVLTMPEAFEIPVEGTDVYRTFVLPMPPGEDRIVAAIEFRPGNPKVVHHSRLFVDDTGDSRRRDAADPKVGFFSGFADGGVNIPHPGLGAWTPGMTPRYPPEGVGMPIKAGSDVVLMIHYHPVGKVEADRSSVGIHFRTTPPTRALAGVILSTGKIDIPAGRERHTIRLRSEIRDDCHAFSITPHAHNLLREIWVTATLPDGTVQPLLWIDDWAFDWQDQYRFNKPIRLPKGTRIDLVARFDNSAGNPHNPFQPPRRIVFGPNTTDEMLACHIEVIPDRPDGYRAFGLKSTFGL